MGGISMLVLFLINLPSASNGKDPSFSQFYANRVDLYPTFVRMDRYISFEETNRVQLLSTLHGFLNYNFTIETQFTCFQMASLSKEGYGKYCRLLSQSAYAKIATIYSRISNTTEYKEELCVVVQLNNNHQDTQHNTRYFIALWRNSKGDAREQEIGARIEWIGHMRITTARDEYALKFFGYLL